MRLHGSVGVAAMLLFALFPLTGLLVAYASYVGMDRHSDNYIMLGYFAALFTASLSSQAAWALLGALVLLGVPP